MKAMEEKLFRKLKDEEKNDEKANGQAEGVD